MRNPIENITHLQTQLNDLQLENQILKNILDNAGIWSMIRNEIMSALYPTGVMPAELVVRANDKAHALEILEAYSAE